MILLADLEFSWTNDLNHNSICACPCWAGPDEQQIRLNLSPSPWSRGLCAGSCGLTARFHTHDGCKDCDEDQ